MLVDFTTCGGLGISTPQFSSPTEILPTDVLLTPSLTAPEMDLRIRGTKVKITG